MAIHYSIPSMIQESLIEKLLVTKYCLEFRKDADVWGSNGCYGHPAIVLLLSITDTIGSYVIGGQVNKHFKILNDNNYYGLALSDREIDLIYKQYRCLSTHNSVIGVDVAMDIGTPSNKVLETVDGKHTLFLVPLYVITQKAVTGFLNTAESVVYGSEQIKQIIGSK